MNKQTKFILAAVIAVIAIIIFIPLDSQENRAGEPREEINQMIDGREIVETVKSPDGGAMIEIAEGSLPEGMSASDLKIELGEANQEGATLYKLSPDGAQFSEPIRVTLIADLPEGDSYEIPLLFHVYEQGEEQVMEPIEGTEVTIDTENGTLRIAGDISHFSNILRMDVKGLFTVTPKSKSTTHNVGDTFEFEAEIAPNKKTVNIENERQVFEESSDFEYLPGSTWGASGGISTRYKNVLKPWEKTVLDRRGLTIHQTFKIKESFTCEAAGNDQISAQTGSNALKVTYKVLEKEKRVWDGKTEVRKTTERDIYTYVHFKEAHKCLGSSEAEEENYNAGPSPDPEGLDCRGVQLQSVLEGGIETDVTKLIDGYCYASGQFTNPTVGEPGCKEDHWHTTLKSIDGSQVRQDSQPCGAAVKSNIKGAGKIWIAPNEPVRDESKDVIIDEGMGGIDSGGHEIVVPPKRQIEFQAGPSETY